MRSMKNSGTTRMSVTGRSAGDGMETAPVPESDRARPWSGSYAVPSHGKRREPKFVPYEPYKAAVSPVVVPPEECETLCIVDAHRASSLADSLLQRYAEETPCDCQKKTATLQEKVAALEKEKKEIMSQYHVQTEVNGDLKKMLVAALGEDVQLKVQFMTEDKALLGKQLLRLSEDLEEAREEAQQWAIQADVWESKFKASSLMVKELSQNAASASLRLRESFRGLEALLQEHDLLFEQLCATHRTLENTLVAFDAKDASPRSLHRVSVSKLAADLNALSSSIQEKLLGSPYRDAVAETGFKYARQYTRAENLVHQTLKSFEEKGVAELSGTADRCTAVYRACPKGHSISFCKHCCGDVQQL